MNTLHFNFTVIAMTETWLKDATVDIVNINGFKHEYEYSKTRSGGGVSVFVKENLNYSRRNDISIFNKIIELLFIEIINSSSSIKKNIILGVIYRPPDTDVVLFNDYLSDILSRIKKENKILYLIGDFNINLLNIDKHVPSAEFLENLYSYNVFPLINKPTRINNVSATLIDNIYCNNTHQEFLNGIFYTDITDHFPIFSIIPHVLNKEDRKVKYRNVRNFSENNITRFQQKCNDMNWNPIIACDDTQTAYSLFHKTFIKMYNECFPLRQVKINSYCNRKPWLTK
jgi:hypothetical protein